MKIATWNVNSLKVRLPQVLEWLASSPVDVLCLQETKLSDDKFPVAEIEAAGYQVAFTGQKTYNGVAILSRHPITDVVKNNPLFQDEQQRIISATIEGMRIVCAYVPNGQAVGSDKYAYKLRWLDALIQWLQAEIQQSPSLALLGDYNIAPTDADVHDPAAWQDQVLVSAPERQRLSAYVLCQWQSRFSCFRRRKKCTAGGIIVRWHSAETGDCASIISCYRLHLPSAVLHAKSTNYPENGNSLRTTRPSLRL